MHYLRLSHILVDGMVGIRSCHGLAFNIDDNLTLFVAKL